MKDSLGDRMKSYESSWKITLPRRLPLIVRIDGKTFHTFTKKFNKPFDESFITNMADLTQHLCKNIPNAVFAYVQSDEISILLHNYRRLTSDSWFANELQKITSVSAGIASSWFSRQYNREAVFDSRAFIIPESDVVNYFVWRQKDWIRNSINMLGQAFFPHKELLGKKTDEVQDMLFRLKGINWSKIKPFLKNGIGVYKENDEWNIDFKIPVFTENRGFIEHHLEVDEE